MSTEQFLWGALTASLGIIATLIGLWWSSMKQSFADIKETLEKINRRLDNVDKEKQDISACAAFHNDMRSKVHQHGSFGTAGEVIK